MGDIFKEQLVKKVPTGRENIQKVGLFGAALIITLILLMIIPSFAFIGAIAAFFGAYLLSTLLNVEYEYIFTNGSVDIDCIYNKNRRKKKINFDVSNIEYMTFLDDKSKDNAFNTAQQTMNFTSGVNPDKVYKILIPVEGKKTKILIEPNDAMLECFEKNMNRLTFTKKQY